MRPVISVIIATKNEERNIRACLVSVKNQSYPPDRMEIIVVDNFSSDQTKAIAGEFTSLVYDYGSERSQQRNFGLEKCRGKYVLFLDADMRLSQKVLAECVEKIQAYNLAALYIPEIVSGKSFFSKIRRFERTFYDATPIDAVRFIKKDVLDKIGGFDEKMYACEDWDLTKRIKQIGAVGIIKSPLYHNESQVALKKYLAKKKYYSQNMSIYLAKWGKDDPDVKKQFGISYRFWGIFTENRKWKKLLAHPILAIGIFFLKFLIGFNFLFRSHE